MKHFRIIRLHHFSTALLISTVFLLGIQPSLAARKGADYYTNAPLVNQDGKTLRFYDDVIKGKVVSINFMFTSCEDSCPLETAKLIKVKNLLGEHVGKNVYMYSISVDPERDTPAVLKDYKKKFKIGDNWQFLTGKKKDIDLIRKRLGMYSAAPGEEEEDLSAHAITFMLGNEKTGQWLKRTPFDLPETLVSVLLGRLQPRSLLSTAATPSYAQSSILRAAEGALRGEDLFRSRCNSCHSIGGQGDNLGPDLLDVASIRDRAWLIRWLQEPDVMLKEKDPIAVALDAKYTNVIMPNLQLEEKDAVALIDYMKEKTRRVTERREKEKAMASKAHGDHGDHAAHQH